MTACSAVGARGSIDATGRAADAAKGRWDLFAERFAFLGNSLLSPMTSETAVGLHAPFWDAFAEGLAVVGCANERLVAGIDHVRRFACAAAVEHEETVERVRMEHARLFAGPPKPEAPPWETFYAVPGRIGEAGFGEAAFAMRKAFREAGIVLIGENNQYADHMGLELLLVAAVCERFAASSPAADQAARLSRFVEERPASWAPSFRAAVEAAEPDGYYRGIAEAAEGLCRCLTAF